MSVRLPASLCRRWIAVSLLLPAIFVVACAARQESTMKKVDKTLQEAMEESSDGTFAVIVTFVKPVEDAFVEELGLMPASPVEALGQLTAQKIKSLAERADVSRIRGTPQAKPS